MRKFIFFSALFCITFLGSFQASATSPTPVNNSSKVDILEERVNNLEKLSESLEKARDNIDEVHQLIIESTNNNSSLVQLLVAIFGLLIPLGASILYKRTRSTIRKAVEREVGDQLVNKLAQISISKRSLEGQLSSMTQKLEYYEHLYELQSPSEDLQIKGIAYFKYNPAENPLVISMLKPFEHPSRKLNIRFESLRARIACGDKEAEDILENLEKEAAASKEKK